jgi:hypothetical protein
VGCFGGGLGPDVLNEKRRCMLEEKIRPSSTFQILDHACNKKGERERRIGGIYKILKYLQNKNRFIIK